LLTVAVSLATASRAVAAAPIDQFPAGALDAGFASGGVLTQTFGSALGDQFGSDAALQADGKIVVLTNGPVSYLSRYLPGGELDVGFGDGGVVALPSAGGSEYFAIALDAAGRIIVVASETGPLWEAPDHSIGTRIEQGVVYRYLPDGEPDASFGSSGKVSISVPPPSGYTPGSGITFATEAVIAADGSITVAGPANAICGWESGEISHIYFEYGTFAARLDEDGSLDQQFGQAGIVSTHGPARTNRAPHPNSLRPLRRARPSRS
jgi:uncharacterized delta-60 repeat protein